MSFHRNIKLIALHNFFTDFVLFAPVAIIYFQQVTGSFALGMSVFSLAYGSSALLEVPTGIISDYVGRKKTLILGSLASVLCVIFYAIGQSYWILLIGSLFQGASRAFYSGNNDALLHDTLAETGRQHEYDEFLGKTSAMFQIALAIAAILGGVIANWSFAWVMWLSVLPQLGAFITATKIIEPPSHSTRSGNIYAHLCESTRYFLSNYRLRYLSLASIFKFSLSESSYFLRSAFVNSLWPLWAVGISNFLSNIGAAVGFYFSGKVIKRFGSYPVLVANVTINRVINIFSLLFPTVFSPALMATTSLGYGVGSVAQNGLLQKEFTNSQRATMGSINSFAGNIAFAFFSILLGYLGDVWGIRNALLVSHVLLFLPLLFYLLIVKTDPHNKNYT